MFKKTSEHVSHSNWDGMPADCPRSHVGLIWTGFDAKHQQRLAPSPPSGLYIACHLHAICQVDAPLVKDPGGRLVIRFGPVRLPAGLALVGAFPLPHLFTHGDMRMTHAFTAPISVTDGSIIGSPPIHIHHSASWPIPH